MNGLEANQKTNRHYHMTKQFSNIPLCRNVKIKAESLLGYSPEHRSGTLIVLKSSACKAETSPVFLFMGFSLTG